MTTHEYPVGATPPLGTPKPAVPRPRTYPGASADDWLRPQPQTGTDPAPLPGTGSLSDPGQLSDPGSLSGTSPLPETAEGADPGRKPPRAAPAATAIWTCCAPWRWSAWWCTT